MSSLPSTRVQELLSEVVAAHLPGEESLIQEIASGLATAEARDRLCQAIAKELAATGLGEDDEPTRRGMELEMLLDKVNRPNLRRPPQADS